MKPVLVFLCVVCLIACSPFRRTVFTYTQNGQTVSQPVLVPRSYTKMEQGLDSLGNLVQNYHYKKGHLFYLAYVRDTNAFVQPIDPMLTLPQVYVRTGARHYKGMQAPGLFWKEVHRGPLRAGYRDVGWGKEYPFDSASTFVAVMPLQ